jgi:uncharacterized damage-inducible protein DinB
MLTTPHLLAEFNAWANARLHAAAASLPAAEVAMDRGAFFGSILGTLNHIYLVDLLYRDRLEGRQSTFKGLDDILHADMAGLTTAQAEIDTHYVAYAAPLTDADLVAPVVFVTLMDQAEEWRVPLSVYLSNLSQHQVHHRGQAYALLNQAGVDVPSIGFIEFCMDEKLGMVTRTPV